MHRIRKTIVTFFIAAAAIAGVTVPLSTAAAAPSPNMLFHAAGSPQVYFHG